MRNIIDLLVRSILWNQAPRHTAAAITLHMVVLNTRTEKVLIDHFFSVPKYVRPARMSERTYDLLTKIIGAVPKRYEGQLQEVVGESFMKLSKSNVSEFQKKKASGA